VRRRARLDRSLVLELDIDRVDQVDRLALARVVAALEHGPAQQRIGRDPEALDDRRAQCTFRMIEWKLDFGEAEHSGRLGRACCRGSDRAWRGRRAQAGE
jgi:hypothetical protein